MVFAFAAAALFVRLGFWQLHRRAQRRAENEVIAAHRALPPVDAFSIASDTANAPYRRTYAKGTLDYSNELVVAPRINNGSPGVWVLTPLRAPGRDTALLVLRGWAYSPDAMTVDLGRWHDADSAFSGFVMRFSEPPKRATTAAFARGRTLRRLELAAASPLIPYPIAPLYLVAVEDSSHEQGNGAAAASRLARISPPALDDGPHLNYAVQWFSFGAIAVVGAIAVAMRSRKSQA